MRIKTFVVRGKKEGMFRGEQAIIHVIKKLLESMTQDTKTIELVEKRIGTEGT